MSGLEEGISAAWYRGAPWLWMLRPLELLFRLLAAGRRRLYRSGLLASYRPPQPLVVVGNITVGDGAKVGSGSVVVESVPEGATVIGVPGRITRINGRRLGAQPPCVLDHGRLPDPVLETLKCLVDRVELLEGQVRDLTKTTPVDWDEEIPITCDWLHAEKKAGQR